MVEFLLAAAGLIVATVAVGLLRILSGPTDADRTMAAQLLGSGGVATLLLVAAATDARGAEDAALCLALLAAFVAIAFVTAAPSVPRDGGEEDRG